MIFVILGDLEVGSYLLHDQQQHDILENYIINCTGQHNA